MNIHFIRLCRDFIILGFSNMCEKVHFQETMELAAKSDPDSRDERAQQVQQLQHQIADLESNLERAALFGKQLLDQLTLKST